MHLFDQRILGIAILFLLAMLVIVKQAATGRRERNRTKISG
jgi:hypothetical protein